MKTKKEDLTQKELKYLFKYDDLSGKFTWNVCRSSQCKIGGEAGTECNLHFCQLCGKWVADADEYYKFNLGAEELSK